MASILPYGFNDRDAIALGTLLHGQGHQLHVCCGSESFCRTLHMRGHRIDLLVLYLSAENRFCSTELKAIKDYRAKYGPKPALLCVPDLYRGPQFELDLEQKGARVAYVK
jgi:hypothetical protein